MGGGGTDLLKSEELREQQMLHRVLLSWYASDNGRSHSPGRKNRSPLLCAPEQAWNISVTVRFASKKELGAAEETP